MSDIIEFDPNVPVVLELKFDTGKQFETQRGPRVKYTTTDDRAFFVDPEQAEEITRLGIRRGMKFRITRLVTKVNGKKATDWLIERLDVQPIRSPRPEPPSQIEQQLRESIAMAQAAKAPAGPQPVARPAAIPSMPAVAHPVSPDVTQSDSTRVPRTIATRMISGALVASIDAYLLAVQYARSKGIDATLDLQFNAEDIRAGGTTFLIEYFKLGGLADAISAAAPAPAPSLNGGVHQWPQ